MPAELNSLLQNIATSIKKVTNINTPIIACDFPDKLNTVQSHETNTAAVVSLINRSINEMQDVTWEKSLNVRPYAFYNCINLTGNPVCGDNVTNIAGTYYNCANLTGAPVCGPKITNMSYAYTGCTNLSGDMYIYSDNVSNAIGCFYNKDNSKVLNIFVNKNTTSLNTLLDVNNSLVKDQIIWDNNSRSYYNTVYNIYIYPVINVYDPYNTYDDLTKLVDFNYIENQDGTYTLTEWKGTYNGEPSTKCIIPEFYGKIRI